MQFKNGFKKVTAVVLSAALTLAPAMTSFAASSEQGVGNIIAYNVETVVVPTAIKLVINPNGYDVNTKYTEVASDADFDENVKYYYKSENGVYSAATDVTDANWDDKLEDGLYTATTSNAQVVSFNYGIASKATRDKTVTVRFDAIADSEIEFVDAATKIAAQNGASDTVGAPQDSHRIFLNLVPAGSGSAVTAQTKAKATTFDEDTTYYKLSDGEYVVETIADAAEFAAVDYDLYEDSTAIGSMIRASELADVTMTPSTAPINFAGEDGKATADVAYMLYRATYNVKEGEFIDWNTGYADVADKFELTSIAQVSASPAHNGGYSAFTFTGQMNTNTDWAALTTRTITIKPKYEIVTATGAEETVSTGLNQVKAGERTEAEVEATELTSSWDSTNKKYKITIDEGVLNATSDITAFKVNDKAVTVAMSLNSTKTIISFTKTDLKTAMGNDFPAAATDDLVITFTVGSTNYTTTIARN